MLQCNAIFYNVKIFNTKTCKISLWHGMGDVLIFNLIIETQLLCSIAILIKIKVI